MTWEQVAETAGPVYSLSANDDLVLASPVFPDIPDAEIEPLLTADGRVWTRVTGFDDLHPAGGSLTADGRILTPLRRTPYTGTAVAVVVGTQTEPRP